MNKKIIMPILMSTLLLSLVSCNNKYNEIDSFNKEVLNYTNSVSLDTFSSLNKKLDDHKKENLNKDYYKETYYYETADTKSKDNSTSYRENSKKVLKHYIAKADYENKLMQEQQIVDTTIFSNIDGLKNREVSHEDDTICYQEINNNVAMIAKKNEVVTDLRIEWDNFIKNHQPQEEFKILDMDPNSKYYIDDNVYTVINVDNNTRIKELRQIVIENDKLSILKLKESKKQPNPFLIDLIDIVVAEYVEITFVNQTLTPINVKGFDRKVNY